MAERVQALLDRFTRGGEPVKDLSRFRGLCRRFGDPQDDLRFIHVAGTNGKGSVVRMTGEICMRAGLRTGEFTSPYIITYNDRIRIDNKNIPDERLDEIADRVARQVSPEEGYSQFEITNIIAFLYFKEEKTDIVVLEAGLGGLLDSTNVIKDNICSCITSVSLDHTAILGDTTEKIAFQKAGIIKPGCPVVISPQNDRKVRKIITDYAEKCGSEVIIPDLDSVVKRYFNKNGGRFVYKKVGYETAMPGKHQLYNALTAIEAARIAERHFPQIDDFTRVMGVSHAVMPSRLEVHKGRPTVIIDGAHNPDAMKKLAEYIKTLHNDNIVMICGMSGTKDYASALPYIAPFVHTALCIDDFAAGAVPAEILMKFFTEAYAEKSSTALERAKALAGEKGIVLIAGSLLMGIRESL